MDDNFDWNWAEKEEGEAFTQNLLHSFYQEHPLYELFWRCLRGEPSEASFNLEDAASLRLPPGFPQGIENHDLLQTCCQNPVAEHALYWLDYCLLNVSFEADQLARALYSGCWGGWFLGERVSLALRLLENGASAEKSSFAGDTPLLSLFRAWDEPSEAPFFGPIAPLCEALLQAGARPEHRNKIGESPLSRISQRLGETLIGMSDETSSADYLRCAQLLLNAGADAASVREAPPLELVVPHPALRGMIQGAQEKAELKEYLDKPALSTPSRESAPTARSGRL